MVNAAAITNRNAQIFEPLSKLGTPDRFSSPVALKNKTVSESSGLKSCESPIQALAASEQNFLPTSQDFWSTTGSLRTLTAA